MEFLTETGIGLAVYLLIINLLAFILMGADKSLAVKSLRRVPEKTFFALTVFGGGPGVYLGMKCFRHKTKHPTFYIGIPAIIILEVAAFSYFFLTK